MAAARGYLQPGDAAPAFKVCNCLHIEYDFSRVYLISNVRSYFFF